MEKKALYDLLNKASADTKKSLNKEEQKKYRSILFEALKEEGINDENVYFITSGIRFKSANTFATWCCGLQNEAQLAAYEYLTKSRAFNSMENAVKLRFVLMTIAYFVSEQNSNQIIVCDLFHSIVDYSLKKDGKRLSDIGKIFQHNFMNELKYSAKLPVIAEFGFSQEYTVALMEFLNQAVEEISPKGDEEITRRNILRDWVRKNSTVNGLSDEKLENIPKVESEKQDVCNSGLDSKGIMPEGEKPEFKGPLAKKIMEFAMKVDVYEQSLQKLTDEVKQKEKELAKCKMQVEKMEELYKSSSEENSELRSRLQQLAEEMSELKNREKELQDRISRQSSVIDIIDEDKDRSIVEFKNQIASALKKTYDEFVIALTMDMTVDLGLNMRDSLDDVFRKLKKQGIDIEGR